MDGAYHSEGAWELRISNLKSQMTDSVAAGLRCGVANVIPLTLLALASPAVLAGCQSARVSNPLTRTVGGNDADQQLEFWHQLADRPVTSNDEAFHGVLLFTDGTDPANDYAARVSTLKSRGLLAAGFNAPPERAIDRGTLAVALAKALKIRGGVVTSLFGMSPRYATRELQFLNVYPPSSPNQTFSGAEFLGIMAKAEEYQSVPTRGDKAVDVAAEGGGQKAATPPPAATQPALYPPIPREPEPPGSPTRQ